MFALALALMTIAVVAHLVIVVRKDRPLTPPRPAAHELDQHFARTFSAL